MPGYNLASGLNSLQSQLCADLAPGGEIATALENNYGFVEWFNPTSVANTVLCGSNPLLVMGQIRASSAVTAPTPAQGVCASCSACSSASP
jgi:hypothetical protein